MLLVRDEKTGRWNGPAFYTIGEASLGLQLGGEASEVVLLAMTSQGEALSLEKGARQHRPAPFPMRPGRLSPGSGGRTDFAERRPNAAGARLHASDIPFKRVSRFGGWRSRRAVGPLAA